VSTKFNSWETSCHVITLVNQLTFLPKIVRTKICQLIMGLHIIKGWNQIDPKSYIWINFRFKKFSPLQTFEPTSLARMWSTPPQSINSLLNGDVVPTNRIIIIIHPPFHFVTFKNQQLHQPKSKNGTSRWWHCWW
jgi:hypothetical protein